SSDPDDTILRNNMLSIFIAPAVYDPEGGVGREAARFIEFVKASPPLKRGEPVKAPGDVERETRKARVVNGIPIDDTTWSDLRSDPDDTILRNNMLSIFIAPAVYDPEGGVGREAARFIEFVKASPPLKRGEPVKAPGDVERETRKARVVNGIPIDDTTWSDL